MRNGVRITARVVICLVGREGFCRLNASAVLSYKGKQGKWISGKKVNFRKKEAEVAASDVYNYMVSVSCALGGQSIVGHWLSEGINWSPSSFFLLHLRHCNYPNHDVL